MDEESRIKSVVSRVGDNNWEFTYPQELSVHFDYDVVFTRDVFSVENTTLARTVREEGHALFFIDSGVARAWEGLSEKILRWCERYRCFRLLVEPQVVPGGEVIKNSLEILEKVSALANEVGLSRSDYVVIVGGGAVLDAVGFSASLIHRGLRQIRVPTTTLSQGDSGVGVKNGLNRFGKKNFYGVFLPPHAVVNDVNFLSTLSERDWLAGVAEAFKVGIIKEAGFLDLLEASAEALIRRELEAMVEVVKRSAIIHLEHIRTSGDPFEFGSARPLDFGHWSAHKLESLSGNRLNHGEAVAVGIALDLICARIIGLLSPHETQRVLDAMKRCSLRLWDPLVEERLPDGRLAILPGLDEFAEHLGGPLTLAMPEGLGNLTFIQELPTEVIEQAVKELRSSAG